MRRRPPRVITASSPPGILDWALSLPWVVERSHALGRRGARALAVDCPPLDRRRMWLASGLAGAPGECPLELAVFLTSELATVVEEVGLGSAVAPMPMDRVLVSISDEVIARPQDLEALLLTAYETAMA